MQPDEHCLEIAPQPSLSHMEPSVHAAPSGRSWQVPKRQPPCRQSRLSSQASPRRQLPPPALKTLPPQSSGQPFAMQLSIGASHRPSPQVGGGRSSRTRSGAPGSQTQSPASQRWPFGHSLSSEQPVPLIFCTQ